MSAKAGWYPDPGGGQGLFRYWDGKAWSAATSPNPAAPPPSPGLVSAPGQASTGSSSYDATQGYGQQQYGAASPYGQQSGGAYGQTGQQPLGGAPSGYANYQQIQKKRSPIGWWIAGGALLVAIIVIAVLALRAVTGGGNVTGAPGGQPSSEVCPAQATATPAPSAQPNDGRVHGGPLSYPRLGAPWGSPQIENRVPFGRDAWTQSVIVEPNYQPNSVWVASILVGELQAGDGFFTPEQGSQIVVKCILGEFYGDNPVQSEVKVNEQATIDGHDAWLVESHLTFDIEGLVTKGETLIVAIVSASNRSGLYYASIPDTTPELLPVAREMLKEIKVDG
ncbi:MAG TPA: DUF2510 domain-containing protein [Propionibacteriaceae bacterium]|nr:DUF2510 domain-containing protein [Propionibacteriaceae bacterium]